MSATTSHQLTMPGSPPPAPRQHHVTLDETDRKGRMFIRCRAGCGRAEVPSFDHVDGARRLLDAVSKAKGEHGQHGVQDLPDPPRRRRRRPKQREMFR